MKNEYQKVEQAKGRPLLQWVGKKPIESVQFYPAQEKEVYGDKSAKDFNKLFWGDNLQVLTHLLKEYRGKIDLIYIDPPFDSKADYVRKVKLRGEQIEGTGQGIFEEKQYADIWEKDEYLQFMFERLLLMKELLSEAGSIYLHCDWHKNSYIRILMDEVFGGNNLVREIIWDRGNPSGGKAGAQNYIHTHDTILFFAKDKTHMFFNKQFNEYSEEYIEKRFVHEDEKGRYRLQGSDNRKQYLFESKGKAITSVWNIPDINVMALERSDYPTQKPEALIERIIKASTNEGDVVADFFMGSGTTQVVAQKLGRRWIGCDINKGAIQTATKRLNQIIENQIKNKKKELLDNDFKGLFGFKVLNVNDYDVFKNELVAKDIVMEMYGVEPIKRSYFDGVLGSDLVKIMPMNRVLNKMDIRSILKSVQDNIGNFTVKKQSKTQEAIYEEEIRIICSGMEYDVLNFLKKENKTGVTVEIDDILTDTKDLVFKEYPESKIGLKAKDKKLTIEIKEFFSPLLMRKLELENDKVLKKDRKTKVEDFKQIIDSVAIDVDYNGKLFNAEIMDLPDKKEIVKAKYSWEYTKKGEYTVAIKIVDVLGEEYFETFEVSI